MLGLRRRTVIILVFFFLSLRVVAQAPSLTPTDCPLNLDILDVFPSVAEQVRAVDSLEKRCLTLTHGVDVLLSVYLKNEDYFLVPPEAASSCIQALNSYFQVPNITGLCGLTPAFISRGTNNCQAIQTREDFISAAKNRDSILATCKNGVLANGNTKSAGCAACTKSLTQVANSLRSSGNSNDNLCLDYTSMYTGAFVVNAGPSDVTTLVCLWDIIGDDDDKKKLQWWVYLVISGGAILFAFSCAWIGFLLLRRWRRKHRQSNVGNEFARVAKSMLHGSMKEIGGGLTWYDIEELRAATHNFDVKRIIGQGGFGNVYRGVLLDGSEVACKRFKDCTAAGDTSFLHEVQALASVRHKNLVALRGCCIASLGEGRLAGYQRIIVLDYVKNGTLQDHLFGNIHKGDGKKSSSQPTLSWPQRLKIATDAGRGVQYLHAGAQTQILHRDIKPSNILLDSDFNAMVADFGLVKFTPNGVSHMTTGVAGSFGYIAPEYAMYSQLTEKSDVYSFGIVMLEIISGRKAMVPDPITSELLIDWAWRLFKEGDWDLILDPQLTERGPDEDLKRFAMVALLCAHPQVFYRPTMTMVLRMLEGAQHVPALPDRPIPVTLSKAALQASLAPSNIGSGSYSSNFSSATQDSMRQPVK